MMKKDAIIKICDKTIEYALYLLIFALPFAKALIEVAASFMIVAWLLKRIITRNLRPAATYLDIPIACYILAVALSVAFSTNFALSLKNFGTKTMEYIMLYYIIAEFIVTRKRLDNVVGIMLVSALMVSCDSIFQYLFGFDLLRLNSLEAGRITAGFQMPNGLGGYLAVLLCLSLALSFAVFKRMISFSIRSMSFVMFGLLIITFSRGAWFGFALGLIFLGLFENKKIFIAGLLSLALFGLLISHLSNVPYDLIDRLKSFSLLSDSSLDRKTIWKIALQMIKDRPLIGHGLSTFMGNFAQYGERYLYFRTQGLVPYAHNCYLQIAAETGILGLLSFLSIVVKFLIGSLRSLKRLYGQRYLHAVLSGISAGIVAILGHSAVDTNLYSLQLAVLFWLTLSINASLQPRVKSELRTK